jgi:polyferredoxin
MWVADLKIVAGMGSATFLIVVAITFLSSMLLGPVWCRWLCPLGALYSVFGMASPATVHRDEETCIHCSACNESCPAFLDVEHTKSVRAPECDGCMECVKACPVEGCLQARAFGRLRIAPWAWPLLVVGAWLGIYAVAKLTGNWDTAIPDEAFRQIINSGLLERETPGFF